MGFTVAIIGRPNVGKSTLFNRLVGKKLALVDNTPGVTRDRREGDARIGSMEFTVVDTAGWDDAGEGMGARMRDQTMKAIKGAHVCFFVIDAREGVTALDRAVAQTLRKVRVPIICLANKAEGGKGVQGVAEAFGLGFGDPIPLSAEHGEGLDQLFDALLPFEEATAQDPDAIPAGDFGEDEEPEDGEEIKSVKIAVIGRPNAGKSTLINKLIGEERMITGPEPGLTRDSIGVEWVWKDRRVKLFDTAGMRRKARVEEKLEKLSVADTLRAVRYAEVVILAIDATSPLDKQDLTIADLVEREGRALIIALTKWDLIEDRQALLKAARERVDTVLPQIRGVLLVPVSSLQGRGLDQIMPAVFKTLITWNKRVPTSALNRWLEAMTQKHPPPAVSGRRLRLRYMTQVKSRPPTFALFTTRPGELPESYMRYLANGLRVDFNMPAVPLRLILRKTKNPFTDD
jgi:GTP-binding protein